MRRSAPRIGHGTCTVSRWISNLGKENPRGQQHPSRHRRDQRARRPRGRDDCSERLACAIDADVTNHTTTLCAVRARHHDVTNRPRRQNAANTSANNAADQSADDAADQSADIATNAITDDAFDAVISSRKSCDTNTNTTNHVAGTDQFDGSWTCSGRAANSCRARSDRGHQSAIADDRQPGSAHDAGRRRVSGRKGHDTGRSPACVPARNTARDIGAADCALRRRCCRNQESGIRIQPWAFLTPDS